MGPAQSKDSHPSSIVDLTQPDVLLALLQRHGLKPTKKWGQHFLISSKVVDAILLEARGAAGILEVGPGPGVLTRSLSEGATVIAYEIDPIAVSALSESAPRAEVRFEDALRADLAVPLSELPEPRMIVSNMPYNITGPLLTAFANRRKSVTKMVLMMQLEVGKRILARPGQRECGSLSIFLQSQFEISKVIDAPSGAFYPPPKVQSVVLRFVPRDLDLDPAAESSFFKLIRAAFGQPRKTLLNNLSGYATRAELETMLRQLELPPGIRPHQITMDQWRAIHRSLRA